ncbi:hypothetical protein [Paragemmobacter straminiformis]|nr:hypothetical protein [Gemmobacter straminiformis]
MLRRWAAGVAGSQGVADAATDAVGAAGQTAAVDIRLRSIADGA